MRVGEELSTTEARCLAIAAQGLDRPRPDGPINRGHLRRVMAKLGTIQVDAINVVERTQFLVLFSRLGAYDVDRVHMLTGPGGAWFEYWGHAASLLPVEMQPLFRWRMRQEGLYGESPTYSVRREHWRREHASYITSILREVSERGPLTASQLTDPRRRNGEWWGRRSMGRVTLEYLFARGDLAGWRAPNFERVYDLPQRVLPAELLAAPTPAIEDAHRRLLASAVSAIGIGTARDIANYYMLKVTAARPRLAELVENGELQRVAVEGWRDVAYVPTGARPRRPAREHATLLSPFDSLIWDRDRTNRVFGFDYKIEVYVPAPKRRYGYYVLPLLLGDRLVGRLDLKADRKPSALHVRAAHAEPQVDLPTVAAATAAELDALREWLALDRVVVEGRGGELAAALGRLVADGSLRRDSATDRPDRPRSRPPRASTRPMA
jgi:uncharacterized protein YcaQ